MGPSLSRCNNLGILHISHSSSQSSLWDRSRNNFRKASSPNDSTTIFTILISFLVLSVIIRHFLNFSNISLKISSQIALYEYNNLVVRRAGVWGVKGMEVNTKGNQND